MSELSGLSVFVGSYPRGLIFFLVRPNFYLVGRIFFLAGKKCSRASSRIFLFLGRNFFSWVKNVKGYSFVFLE